MVDKEELVEKFEITGCKNLSDEILEKCVELCQWFDKDEEEFMDMWVAFGINHQDGNLEPTLKGLEEFKRITPRNENKNDERSFKNLEQNTNFLNTSNALSENENDILGIYASSEVLSSMQTKESGSPDLEQPSTSGYKPRAAGSSAGTSAATATSTSTSTQSISSPKLTPSCKILTSSGPKMQSWKNKNKDKRCVISRAGPHVPVNVRYMFELLQSTSEIRTRVCQITGMRMINLWSEENKEKKKEDEEEVVVTWNVRAKHQKIYRTWGRVCFENETKSSTVLLEGCKIPPRTTSSDMKIWPQVELDCNDLRECSVFPGQIVAVEGINLTENLLKARKIFNETFIPPAKPPNLTDDISIVVAAGPFTQSNDLKYQPLWDLMTKIVEDEPHILILIGPFIDYTHPKIQSEEMDCTFEEFFLRLITKIKSYIVGKCTQILLVASSQDAHHHPVYPTPEYSLSKSVQSPQIFVLPDPCNLDIDGLRLGITSVDCLMHIGREEVTIKPSKKDKLSRLASYILNQACYYPLYPAAREVNVDSHLWEEYAFIHEKPHILLLPSDMRYFCKHMSDTLILNPERLSKRTFARIYLHHKIEEFSTIKSISCEIIKM